MMANNNGKYWYISSYPKSGNTWCRAFINDLINSKDRDGSFNKKLGLDSSDSLSLDLDTGSIISSRNWLEDQLGVNSSDLTFKELEKVRGKVGQSKAIYDHSKRYHKVHDAFQSEYTENSPIISTKNCNGAVYIVRNPLDISISLSHFFNWDLAKCVEFILL